MKIFLHIALILWPMLGIAQFDQDNTVQLINGERVLLPYQNKLKADFKFDARRTLFQSNWVAIGGLRLGVQYRRIHKLGFAFYFVNNRLFSRDFTYDIETDLVEYDLSYNTIFYERLLYFDKRWEIGANTHVGGGRIFALYTAPGTNFRTRIDEIQFSVSELSTFVNYSIFYWLGIGAGMGYRRIWAYNRDVDRIFSGPIFTTSLQIRFIKLGKSFFDESVKDEF